eukprot:1156039-Pelagomonas_calceolata.AAC.8
MQSDAVAHPALRRHEAANVLGQATAHPGGSLASLSNISQHQLAHTLSLHPCSPVECKTFHNAMARV